MGTNEPATPSHDDDLTAAFERFAAALFVACLDDLHEVAAARAKARGASA